MLVRLVLVPGVLVFMLLRATCVAVFMRVRVLVRMAVFRVSMLVLMVMLVSVFVFHELPPSSRIRRSERPRGVNAFRPGIFIAQ
jgi:hypothetical protein